jgi:hypothetical protein
VSAIEYDLSPRRIAKQAKVLLSNGTWVSGELWYDPNTAEKIVISRFSSCERKTIVPGRHVQAIEYWTEDEENAE